MDIENLRTRINAEISNRISERNFYDVLVTKTLKAKLKHLSEIEEILSYDKYKIAFIGTVGAGKTTAICHLFNLLNYHEKEEDSDLIEVSEILKTGVGYTTLCEVELLLGDTDSKIVIEPYNEQELKDILNVFAEFIQNSINPDKDNPNQPGKQIITPELNRALRNIINLNEIFVKGKKVDLCKEEFAKSENLEKFKELIITRAEIHNRKKIEINYPTLYGNERLWLKETFDDLNSAKLPEFSLPKKIYIHLSSNIIKKSLFENFESIIDTKGIDANENRKDIDDYIKDKRTICVFTTEYQNAPDANIRNLLEYHFNDKLSNYQTKVAIVVLSKKNQPESEQGANNREEGIIIRRGIIQDVLNGLGITEIPDSNIPFYDALLYYNKEVRKLLFNPKNTKKVESDRDELALDLLNTIDERRDFYKKEFYKLESDVNQILAGVGLSDDEERLIIETKNKIHKISNLNFYSYKDLTDKFINYFKYNYAPMTIKAINRRYGFYDLRGIDIFYDAQKIGAESILRTVTKDINDKIMKLLTELRTEINNDDIGKLIDEIQTQFQTLYKTFISDTSIKIYDFLHNQKLDKGSKYDFWNDVMDLKGSGYRERVGATFRDELETKSDNLPDTNEYFKTITENMWDNYVIANITNYFER
ncbi:MAG: hypothetical protein J0L94_09915 [Rhodothermia bacterium]|nr:hypothetical protein [Rhodothermia bacterium]